MSRLFAVMLLVLSATAEAHPGEHHDSLLNSIIHLFSEPDHLLMMAVAIAAGVWFARRSRKAKREQHHG